MPFTKHPLCHYLPNQYLQLHLINLSFSKTPSIKFVICNNTHFLWAINHHWRIRLTASYRDCFTPYRRIERIAQSTHVLLLRILPSMIHQFSSCSLKVGCFDHNWHMLAVRKQNLVINGWAIYQIIMQSRSTDVSSIRRYRILCTVPYSSNDVWTNPGLKSQVSSSTVPVVNSHGIADDGERLNSISVFEKGAWMCTSNIYPWTRSSTRLCRREVYLHLFDLWPAVTARRLRLRLRLRIRVCEDVFYDYEAATNYVQSEQTGKCSKPVQTSKRIQARVHGIRLDPDRGNHRVPLCNSDIPSQDGA